MQLLGVDFLNAAAAKPHFSAKMVFNQRGAIFFPIRQQHRDMKAPGISYEDNYRGDALAAMLAPGKIEIRFHERFSDLDVAGIMGQLLAMPELAMIAACSITYQRRPILLG